jgi:acetyl-CoA synthetase
LSCLEAAVHNRPNARTKRPLAKGAAGGNAMSDDKIFDVPADWAKRAWVDDAKYKQMYAASIADPNKFWGEHAKRLTWIKPFTKVKNASFAPGNISIKWFEDGTLNACFNCVDRHLEKRGNQTAIIWEGDDPKDDKTITYKELHAEVQKFANVLKKPSTCR